MKGSTRPDRAAARGCEGKICRPTPRSCPLTSPLPTSPPPDRITKDCSLGERDPRITCHSPDQAEIAAAKL